jgi:hypothetical protein
MAILGVAKAVYGVDDLACPAGGHAEYIADQDYLDDSWMPRDWEENFGGSVWIHDIPEHMKKPYSWDVKLYDEDAAL